MGTYLTLLTVLDAFIRAGGVHTTVKRTKSIRKWIFEIYDKFSFSGKIDKIKNVEFIFIL